jgi:hypothetical protein
MTFVEAVNAFIQFAFLHELLRYKLKTVGHLNLVISRFLTPNAQASEHAFSSLSHLI